jgi:hypothetical protein
MSFKRNYLWKKELVPHFSNYYLLDHIWDKHSLKDYDEIRASFIELVMSLYIDHDPLNEIDIPQYCRIFNQVDTYNKAEVRVKN